MPLPLIIVWIQTTWHPFVKAKVPGKCFWGCLRFQKKRISQNFILLLSNPSTDFSFWNFSTFSNHSELIPGRNDKDSAEINIFRDSHYLLKNNIENTRTTYEICSELTIITPERPDECLSGAFTVNFEQILHIILVFLLLTLNK